MRSLPVNFTVTEQMAICYRLLSAYLCKCPGRTYMVTLTFFKLWFHIIIIFHIICELYLVCTTKETHKRKSSKLKAVLQCFFSLYYDITPQKILVIIQLYQLYRNATLGFLQSPQTVQVNSDSIRDGLE